MDDIRIRTETMGVRNGPLARLSRRRVRGEVVIECAGISFECVVIDTSIHI